MGELKDTLFSQMPSIGGMRGQLVDRTRGDKYIWGIVKNNNCKLYRVNGIEDHIHIFSDLHPSVCLADYVKDIKVASSIWMKDSGMFLDFKGWQDGYGAFTYSKEHVSLVASYIARQEEHHKKILFRDEYRQMLIDAEIEFEEKFIFCDLV